MVQGEKQFCTIANGEAQQIALLPIDDPGSADFILFRQDPFMPEGTTPPPVKTGEQLLVELAEGMRGKLWFLLPEIEGRAPVQQWKMNVNDHRFNLFNYAPETTVTQDQAERVAYTVGFFEGRFPGALKKLNVIAVTDKLPDSLAGNPAKFPTHGYTKSELGYMALAPRTLSDEPYRNGQLAGPTLEAVVAHEMVHLWDDSEYLKKEWEDLGNTWRYAEDRLGVGAWVADRPERCVTDYARRHITEDIPESIVSYLYAPKVLRWKAPEKLALLSMRDRHKTPNHAEARHVIPPKGPPIPKSMTYFVDEDTRF